MDVDATAFDICLMMTGCGLTPHPVTASRSFSASSPVPFAASIPLSRWFTVAIASSRTSSPNQLVPRTMTDRMSSARWMRS